MLSPGICSSYLHRYPRQREWPLQYHTSYCNYYAAINPIGLEGLATDLVNNSFASSSRRSYTSAQRHYVQFCECLNFIPIPATERQLVLFVAELAQRLSHSTVRSYLSAIRHMQIAEDLGDPLSNALRLQLAMKGLKQKTNGMFDYPPLHIIRKP